MLLARAGELIADLPTDAGGRIPELGGDLPPGAYRLSFETGLYFGSATHLFDRISLDLTLDGTTGHQHLPLLISPFGVSAYRGS